MLHHHFIAVWRMDSVFSLSDFVKDSVNASFIYILQTFLVVFRH